MKTKTVKQIQQLYSENKLTDSIIEQLRQDDRKGIQRIVLAYERQQLKKRQTITQFNEMSHFERHYWGLNKRYIAGVDEAGRGPLAGPVVAAAVMLREDFELYGLTDSKQLNERTRSKFAQLIKEQAISYHIAVVNHEEIDAINIYEATKRAMTQALRGLNPMPERALIDAVTLESLPFPTEAIIKGDEKSISIAAASVLAKVARDEIMKEIDDTYPMYGFKNNMGYGTKEHLQMIEKYGISPYHRKSFAPVKRFISGGDR